MMEKTYNPKQFEDKLYKDWEEGEYFKAVRDDDKVPFTVMMPPPNITGQLHMGHAMDETMQDTVIRFKRMQGLLRPFGCPALTTLLSRPKSR